MTSLSETFLKKRAPTKRDFPRPAIHHPGSPVCFQPWPIKRILERWKECWRLAALPASDNTPKSSEAVVSRPMPSFREPEEEYVPIAGMRGKDVQWVPCSPVVIDKMLDMAKVTPDDYVIDPGSGDGRIAIRVAKRGARALGIEANPKLVALSEKNAENEGVNDRVIFSVGDLFDTDLSEATVVTLFLRRDLNLKLRPKILDLKPGTRVVSNIFDMGDWKADEVVKVEDGDYYFRNHTAYLWIVPVKVNGIWKLPDGELVISQKYQMIGGTLSAVGKTTPIEGKITGNRIDFSANGGLYSGRVTEDRMILESNDGSSIQWTATLINWGFEDYQPSI